MLESTQALAMRAVRRTLTCTTLVPPRGWAAVSPFWRVSFTESGAATGRDLVIGGVGTLEVLARPSFNSMHAQRYSHKAFTSASYEAIACSNYRSRMDRL